MISSQILSNSLDYPHYRSLLEELMSQGKTTGPNQSEEYLNYARINLQRMERLGKTTQLNEDLVVKLKAINRSYIWLVLTEGWCGDAAQNLPVIHLMTAATPKIELRLLLRDENPQLMDHYLTNGARAIPKLICLEKTSMNELFTWGPRPAPLQEIVLQLRKNGVSKQEKGVIVQKWYNSDKTQTVQGEFLALLDKLV